MATEKRNAITHVIYDMDGVLLDTEPFYTKVATIIAGRFGRVFDGALKSRMIGKRAADAAAIFVEALGLPITATDLLAMRQSLLEELLLQAEPLPGAMRLTTHLHAHGIPQAVATSSDGHHFELKTRRHKTWFGTFQCIVIGDDPALRYGKPAPDIFLLAARSLGADPAACLVFEDAPAGVEAARAAGMNVIALPDRNVDASQYAGAHQILSGLAAFQPPDWGLPPFGPVNDATRR